MAEKEQSKQLTHRAYSVIRREGQDDFWLNIGLAFPRKDGKGFNTMLQAFALDGKIVCREVTEEDEQTVRNPSDPPVAPALAARVPHDGYRGYTESGPLLHRRPRAACRWRIPCFGVCHHGGRAGAQLLCQELASERAASIGHVPAIIRKV
jgi:hypothetical protein